MGRRSRGRKAFLARDGEDEDDFEEFSERPRINKSQRGDAEQPETKKQKVSRGNTKVKPPNDIQLGVDTSGEKLPKNIRVCNDLFNYAVIFISCVLPETSYAAKACKSTNEL